MARLGDVIGKPRDPEEGAGPEQQLFEAIVVNTPSGPGDQVFVKIPSFDDGKHKFGPVVWDPIELGGKELMPEANDICLVAKPSITGSVWLLAWR
jgi:hypothetical protein